MRKTIGERLSLILVEIEETLWEFEANNGTKPGYTDSGFRATLKIFMSSLMDRMWELQESEKINQKDREKMAIRAGKDIRRIVKIYTDIDTTTLYDK